jgi:hypothetical protein
VGVGLGRASGVAVGASDVGVGLGPPEGVAVADGLGGGGLAAPVGCAVCGRGVGVTLGWASVAGGGDADATVRRGAAGAVVVGAGDGDGGAGVSEVGRGDGVWVSTLTGSEPQACQDSDAPTPRTPSPASRRSSLRRDRPGEPETAPVPATAASACPSIAHCEYRAVAAAPRYRKRLRSTIIDGAVISPTCVVRRVGAPGPSSTVGHRSQTGSNGSSISRPGQIRTPATLRPAWPNRFPDPQCGWSGNGSKPARWRT